MRQLLFLFLIFSFAGCEGRFTPNKNTPKGQRLSVLSVDNTLQPNSNLSNIDIALPRPYENENWSQDGGGSDNFMQHLFIADEPKLLWKNKIGKGSKGNNILLTNPVIYKKTIFTINSNGFLTSTNLENGKHLWNLNLVPKNISSGMFGGGISVYEDNLYISTDFGYVYSINYINGAINWSKNIGIPLRGSPTVDNGKLFFISILNQTYALEANTGNILWLHSGLPETTSFLGGVSPAVKNNIVISPYSSGNVYAFNSDDGKVIWAKKLIESSSRLSMIELSDIHSRPVIDGREVYLSGSGGKLISADIFSGKTKWTKEISTLSSPWVSGNFIYLITSESQLICIHKVSGLIKWVNNLPRYKKQNKLEDKILWVGPILVSDRLVLLSSNGTMLAISPYSGKALGNTKLSSEALIEPVIAMGTMIVLTDDGYLTAYK